MLLETLSMHMLLTLGKANAARTIDAAVRIAGPLLYVLVLGGFLLEFTTSGVAVVTYVIVVLVLLLASVVGFVTLTLRRRRRRLEAFSAKMIADGVLQGDDHEAREAALVEVFAAFDPLSSPHHPHLPSLISLITPLITPHLPSHHPSSGLRRLRRRRLRHA